jgi:DNA-binding transcriptional LysR family regulator
MGGCGALCPKEKEGQSGVDPTGPGVVRFVPRRKVLLAANKGIFILADEIGARADSSHVAVPIPLEEPDARIALYMAWRKGERSSAVLALLDTARKVLQLGTSRSTPTRMAASA